MAASKPRTEDIIETEGLTEREERFADVLAAGTIPTAGDVRLHELTTREERFAAVLAAAAMPLPTDVDSGPVTTSETDLEALKSLVPLLPVGIKTAVQRFTITFRAKKSGVSEEELEKREQQESPAAINGKPLAKIELDDMDFLDHAAFDPDKVGYSDFVKISKVVAGGLSLPALLKSLQGGTPGQGGGVEGEGRVEGDDSQSLNEH